VKEEQNPEKPRYYGYISCAIFPLNIIFCYFVEQNTNLFGGGWASFFNMLIVFWAIALVGFVIGIVNLVKGIKDSSLNYKQASYIGLIINGIPALLGIGILVYALGSSLADNRRQTSTTKPASKSEFYDVLYENMLIRAEEGDPKMQNDLAKMYQYGEGTKKPNLAESVKWYRKAAEQGFGPSQTNLGIMYDNGEGVLEDDMTAYAWHTLAATNGDAKAKENKSELAKMMTAEDIAKAEALAKEMIKKNPKLIN